MIDAEHVLAPEKTKDGLILDYKKQWYHLSNKNNQIKEIVNQALNEVPSFH